MSFGGAAIQPATERQVGFQWAMVGWEGSVLEERRVCTKQAQNHKGHIPKVELPKVQKLPFDKEVSV